MKLLKNTIRLMKRRPSALLFIGVVMLVYAIIDSYNPILPIFLGLGSITEGGISEGILSVLQFMIDPEIIPMIILLIFCVSGIGAVVLGFVFSGYCYTINNGIAGRKKFKGELIAGLKKYFLKLTWISFRVIFIGILLIIFLLVASVPAVIITNAADISEPKLLAAALLIDVITVGVIFLGSMYFRIYMFFWYPAAVNQAERPFTAGVRAANRDFWGITGRFLTFDIFFIVAAFILLNINSSLYRIIGTWIFGTLYVVLFSAYIFFAFKINNTAKKDD